METVLAHAQYMMTYTGQTSSHEAMLKTALKEVFSEQKECTCLIIGQRIRDAIQVQLTPHVEAAQSDQRLTTAVRK